MPGYELIANEELEQIKRIFSNGKILCRQGFDSVRNNTFLVKEFEEQFKKKLKSKYSLAVTSGTAALRVALAALDIGPGDEVITTTFTFVATVEAIIESGAQPICVDINETLNIDVPSIKKHITPKTKAIICVHMLGVPCDLKALRSLCDKEDLFLIEDTAWGLGAKFENKFLGTWGDIGTFSFDFAKAITTGEGGMLTFNNFNLWEKACAWHDHGHENNPRVPRWEDTRKSSGFNYRMNELMAAVGLAQIEKLDEIITLQRKNSDKLADAIRGFSFITKRPAPHNSYQSEDALVLKVSENYSALEIRNILVRKGLSTKILPEAISWHFAGCWEHMKELKKTWHNKNPYKKSEDILSRCIALPVPLKMNKNYPDILEESLSLIKRK